MREEVNMKRKICFVFDDLEVMIGDDYVILIGFRKCYFDDILIYVSFVDVWVLRLRSIKLCIVVFLIKLRILLDNKFFVVLFNMFIL